MFQGSYFVGVLFRISQYGLAGLFHSRYNCRTQCLYSISCFESTAESHSFQNLVYYSIRCNDGPMISSLCFLTEISLKYQVYEQTFLRTFKYVDIVILSSASLSWTSRFDIISSKSFLFIETKLFRQFSISNLLLGGEFDKSLV